MKRVKKIVFIFFGIVVLLLLIALFIPTQIIVERNIVISRNQQETFEYIKYLKNQELYGVWWKADPNMKINTKGKDGTIGYVHAWKSEDDNVGEGQQRIVNLVLGSKKSRLDIELKFIKPFESINPSYMSTEFISEKKSKVTWSITSNMPYPFNLFGAVMNMEERLGNDLNKGLKNLKVILEK